MINKHFFKTLILFTLIILLGLAGVYLINAFDGAGNTKENTTAVAK